MPCFPHRFAYTTDALPVTGMALTYAPESPADARRPSTSLLQAKGGTDKQSEQRDADCCVTPPSCATLLEASTIVACVAASGVAVVFAASDVVTA